MVSLLILEKVRSINCCLLFGQLTVTLSESMPVPFDPTGYIMDFTNSLERQELEFWLYFKKIIWYRPIILDNAMLIDVLYHQVRQPDCFMLLDMYWYCGFGVG